MADATISLESAAEHRRRARLNLWMAVATLAANACGAGLVSRFSYILGGATFDILASNPTMIVLSQVLLPALLATGVMIATRIEKPLTRWYLHRDPLSQPPPSAEVQRLMLEGPLRAALISLGMWSVGGLAVGVMVWLASGAPSLADGLARLDLTMAVAMAGIAGPITAVLAYFMTERLYYREIPLFFAGQRPGEAGAFRLTITWRLALPLMVVIALMLVLAWTAYTQAALMAAAPQPAVILERMGELTRFVLLLALIVTLLLAITLGTPMARAVRRLQQQMGAVRQGQLEEPLAVTSNDEFGDLAAGFNEMTAGLRQEQVIRRLFSLYVTPEVAEHAIRYGAALGGQLTQASVLFLDIRGFTAMTERLLPETMIALLNRFFQAMSAEIVAHGGLVNKFGGDSLLAVFGSPLNPAAEHATEAVRAGQAILAALERFNREQEGRKEPELRIGVGIASGPVVAGNVGSQERLEYTVMGDTVNLASRLQSMTKEMDARLLLSESTARLVKGQIGLVSMGQIEVRGKQELVEVYKTNDS